MERSFCILIKVLLQFSEKAADDLAPRAQGMEVIRSI